MPALGRDPRGRGRLEAGPGPLAKSLLRQWESKLAGLACAALVVTGVTLVLFPLRELDPGVSSGVLYVLERDFGITLPRWLQIAFSVVVSASSRLRVTWSPL